MSAPAEEIRRQATTKDKEMVRVRSKELPTSALSSLAESDRSLKEVLETKGNNERRWRVKWNAEKKK